MESGEELVVCHLFFSFTFLLLKHAINLVVRSLNKSGVFSFSFSFFHSFEYYTFDEREQHRKRVVREKSRKRREKDRENCREF